MPRKKKIEQETKAEPEVRAHRPRRVLHDYNRFVQAKYAPPEVQAAAVRDRLRIIGAMWQEQKKQSQQ